MSTGVYGAPLEALEGETKTLGTSPGYIAVAPGWTEVKMYCASQWRLALSPALLHCVYYDTSALTYTDYRTEATDGISTTHVPLDAMPHGATVGDWLYLGFSSPALGAYFDVGTNANANTAALDMEYCSTAVDGGTAIVFTDVGGDSDGTDSTGNETGATMEQDGVYTWTLPTAWVASVLGTDIAPEYTKCYWVRFKPSATLSATVDINEIIPVYKNTNYGYMEPGVEYQFSFENTKVGGFVVLSTAGTPALDVTWVKH